MASQIECCAQFEENRKENEKSLNDTNKKIAELQVDRDTLIRSMREAKEKAEAQQDLMDSGKTYNASIISQSKSTCLSAASTLIKNQKKLISLYSKKETLLRENESIKRMIEKCKQEYNTSTVCSDPDLAEKCCEKIPSDIKNIISQKSNGSNEILGSSGFVDVVGDPSEEPRASRSTSKSDIKKIAQYSAVPSSGQEAAVKQANRSSGDDASAGREQTAWPDGENVFSYAKRRSVPKNSIKIVGPASSAANKPSNTAKISKTTKKQV